MPEPVRSSRNFGSRPRGPRFKTGAPYLVPILVAAVAGVLLWRTLYHADFAEWRGALQSPESQVHTALAHQTRAALNDVYGFKAGGTVELDTVAYGDVVVSIDGQRATVTARLDADGRVRWREERAKISYLGREQFHMKPCSIALWCAEGDQFTRLRGVLTTLFRREDAFNAGDADAYGRLLAAGYPDRDAVLARLRADFGPGPQAKVRIRAWQIRVDRDTGEAGEDYDIKVGDGDWKPLRARYDLRREGDRWVIAGGI